jgi:uncharacterized integral membrane protein (TIGR00698 family)
MHPPAVAVRAQPLAPRRPEASRAVADRVPGLLAAAVVAAVATVLGGWVPVAGAPVIAIVVGIVVAATRPVATRLDPGLHLASKGVLQGSIVLLGLNLSLSEVLATGRSSLPVLIGTLGLALAAAAVAGRCLRLRGDLALLIGVGTAVCGASAIAATDAVIDADDADVSYAIATIFAFNVVAVLAYPSLGHLLGLSPHGFGLWAGTAVNDMSSVVAATTVYGHGALAYGVVVKLVRTLAIIPICLGLAAWRNRRPAARVGRAAGAGRPILRRVVPMFILGFVAAVALDSAGVVPTGWHHGLSDLSTWMITAALAAIGLSTKPRSISRAGARPMVLGAILWAVVGLSSLGLQALTPRL